MENSLNERFKGFLVKSLKVENTSLNFPSKSRMTYHKKRYLNLSFVQQIFFFVFASLVISLLINYAKLSMSPACAAKEFT